MKRANALRAVARFQAVVAAAMLVTMLGFAVAREWAGVLMLLLITLIGATMSRRNFEKANDMEITQRTRDTLRKIS